jgi:hypothetical protein
VQPENEGKKVSKKLLLGSKLYENGLEIIEKKIHCCRYYPERLAQKKMKSST